MEVPYISVHLRVLNESFLLQFSSLLLEHFLFLVFKIFSERALHNFLAWCEAAATQFHCCLLVLAL